MSANDTPPWDPDKTYIKVTLKGGKGYEDSWVNIGASNVGELRRSVAAFFGWREDELDGLSPAQIAFNATQEWHAMNNVGRAFDGARATRSGSSARDRAYAEAAKQDPKDVLLAQIEAQETVLSLKRLYGENKATFEDKDNDGNPTAAAAELTAAYKAKGKALSVK